MQFLNSCFQVDTFVLVRFCKKVKSFVGDSAVYVIFVQFTDNSVDFFLSIAKPFQLGFRFRLKLFRFFFRTRQILVCKFLFVKKNILAYFLQIVFYDRFKIRYQNSMTTAQSFLFLTIGRTGEIVHFSVSRHTLNRKMISAVRTV